MAMLDCYRGSGVFLTGHTGFKGGWLALWLARLGARVTGYSLPPATDPCLFDLARISRALQDRHFADIRDASKLTAAMQAAQPRFVFHLAAQPLVRHSYQTPQDTWATNVMGSVNVLEAVRACPSVRAIVVVTTDKCYENHEWVWGYRETDPLGGHDPYSASKAGAELVVSSYRKSFLAASDQRIASARAGNVIGGGDWSDDRLIPDAVRAIATGRTLRIRNPGATRPWQHVLESLHGYLLLGARLVSDDGARFADAFNFGPSAADNRTVSDVLQGLKANMSDLNWELDAASSASRHHEAGFLYLDSSKATRLLGWKPRWDLDRALAETARWYRAVQDNPSSARALCESQIETFSSAI